MLPHANKFASVLPVPSTHATERLWLHAVMNFTTYEHFKEAKVTFLMLLLVLLHHSAMTPLRWKISSKSDKNKRAGGRRTHCSGLANTLER